MASFEDAVHPAHSEVLTLHQVQLLAEMIPSNIPSRSRPAGRPTSVR